MKYESFEVGHAVRCCWNWEAGVNRTIIVIYVLGPNCKVKL